MKNPCRIGKTDMKTRRLMEGNREERNECIAYER